VQFSLGNATKTTYSILLSRAELAHLALDRLFSLLSSASSNINLQVVRLRRCVYKLQETEMVRVIEYFAKSLKVIQNDSLE